MTEPDVDDLIRDLQGKYPKLRIIGKPLWMRRIWNLPLIRQLELDYFTQTIGNTIYLHVRWDTFTPEQKYITLAHEAVHLEQFKRLGFLLMSLLYLFIFLPIGLAYFRARMEREAYRESFRVQGELYGMGREWKGRICEEYLEDFAGRYYLWPWPFRETIIRWVQEDVSSILLGRIQKVSSLSV